MTTFNKRGSPWMQKHHNNPCKMRWGCSGRSLIILLEFSRKKKNHFPGWLLPGILTPWLMYLFILLISCLLPSNIFRPPLICHLGPPILPDPNVADKIQSHRITKWVFSESAFQSTHVYSTGVKLKTYENEIALFLLFFCISNAYFAIKSQRYICE